MPVAKRARAWLIPPSRDKTCRMNIARLSRQLAVSAIAALALMRAGYASGQSSGDYNGFEWFSADGLTAQITGYDGPGGNVAIPAVIVDLLGTNYSVTSVGDQAFYYFPNLTGVTIPSSVTSLGETAFGGTSLTSVAIPSSVTLLGDGVFEGCYGLASVTIGPSVASIGAGAFEECFALGSVSIPASVTSIGVAAFSGCTHLTAINVAPQNLYYSSTNGVLFDKAVTTLLGYPGGLGGSYTVPKTVTSIGDYAFADSALSGVTIPVGVTSIGNSAFNFCSALLNVAIPVSVSSIASYAFGNCAQLAGASKPGEPARRSRFSRGQLGNTIVFYLPASSQNWGSAFGGRPTRAMESPGAIRQAY